MGRLRIGIVGCGEHAAENLLPSLWLSQSANVVGLCDNDMTVVQAAASRFPNATAYSDFHSLINNAGAEAIVVAAPPNIHHDVAQAALRSGLHVFVEKPPTVTTTDLVELAALAEQSGLITGVGHNLRHATASRQLQKCIKASSFGRPLCMDMRYFASKPLGDRWGLNSVLRSFLLSHANHALDLMVFQMGAADSINATGTLGPGGSIALSAQIRFRSRAVGNLLVTTAAPHFSLSVTVVGENATIAHMDGLREITVYGINDDEKRWGRCWLERTLEGGFEHSGYQSELDLFINAVQGRETMHPTFRDEIAVYELIDEIETQVATSVEPVNVAD